MRIAVLGAGLTGILTALELSESGHKVDLYDRAALPFSGASLNCEGKIHLGYVYALDQSLNTAKAMINGATSFRTLTERWVGEKLFQQHTSEPFTYAVPKQSMMNVADIRHYFKQLKPYIQQKQAGRKGHDGSWGDCWQLSQNELRSIFDPAHVIAAFRTQEEAVDTEALALALRDAVDNAPGLNSCMHNEIIALKREGRKIQVIGKREGQLFEEPYDSVVNALWEQRLFIDASLGLKPDRPVMHRFKFGLFTRKPEIVQSLPSVTFLIGSFGDTVGFRDNAYVSWYPAGLVSQECALKPSVIQVEIDNKKQQQIITQTVQNLQRLMPERAACLNDDPETWQLKGGFVTAWGKSGIDDADSELHQRHAIGVHSADNYHSIDTGKLTVAPMFAREVCERINGVKST